MNRAIALFAFIVISNSGMAQRGSNLSMPWIGSTTTSQNPGDIFPSSQSITNKTDTTYKPWRTVKGSIVAESVLIFSPFFDDKLIDSFWEEYNHLSAKADNDKSNQFIHLNGQERTYLFLFKVIYGDNFQLSEEQKFILTDTVLHKRTAQIISKASSSKARGILSANFSVGDGGKIELDKINFVPFDHSKNAFVDNLCGNELTMIKTQQSSVLIDTISVYADSDKIKNIKGLRKKLESIKLPDSSPFTSRLFIENDSLWVVGIYDTDKAGERLLLGYKFINKKFKPALIEIIKKGG